METVKEIAIIGAGNIGFAIANGLVNSGIKRSAIWFSDIDPGRLSKAKSEGFNAVTSNSGIVSVCQVIFLCVTPQVSEKVLKEIPPDTDSSKTLISLVTGLELCEINRLLNNRLNSYRAVVSIASENGMSAVCLARSEENKSNDEVIGLLSRLGKITIIDEALMNAATVLAATGIAFAMKYIRSTIQGGIEIGFSSSQAQEIVSQTVKGAASILLNSMNHPESEIDKVTTPMGITITGLNEMAHYGFDSSVVQGIKASYQKIEMLGKKT